MKSSRDDRSEREDLKAAALQSEQAGQICGVGHSICGNAREALVVGAKDVGTAARDTDNRVQHLIVERVGGMAGVVGSHALPPAEIPEMLALEFIT
jgi:hypothetical protein